METPADAVDTKEVDEGDKSRKADTIAQPIDEEETLLRPDIVSQLVRCVEEMQHQMAFVIARLDHFDMQVMPALTGASDRFPLLRPIGETGASDDSISPDFQSAHTASQEQQTPLKAHSQDNCEIAIRLDVHENTLNTHVKWIQELMLAVQTLEERSFTSDAYAENVDSPTDIDCDFDCDSMQEIKREAMYGANHKVTRKHVPEEPDLSFLVREGTLPFITPRLLDSKRALPAISHKARSDLPFASTCSEQLCQRSPSHFPLRMSTL
jgi:hypothetical protein